MPRKKSLLGQCNRKSAPVPTRQLLFFSTDVSPTRTGSIVRSGRAADRKSRIPKPRAMRHLSLESEERLPLRRSRSAFATPETYKKKELFALSTQRRNVCTPSSSGSYQPWLSTTKKIGKAKKTESEKHELAEMVFKIQDYFSRQDLGVSLIPLSGLHQRIMTLNLFVGLVSHLLSVFYPRHGITMANYTDKLPGMLKALGYTGNLTKSWLRTANNSHSWPHVLKLLSFLVDLVEMKPKVIADITAQMEHDMYEDTPVSYKDLFDYYLDTYVSWDRDQVDDLEVARSQLEEKFNVGLCSDEELKALAEEVEQLKQRLDDPHEAEEEARFQELKAEHDALQEEFMKESAEVTAEEKVLNGLQQQLLDLSVQKENLEEELQAKRKQLQLKRMQVSVQKVSLEEKLLVDEKMASLRVDIDNMEAIKCSRMEDICKKDMEISHLLRNISEEKEKFKKKLQEVDDPRVQELCSRPDVSHDELSRALADVASSARNRASAVKNQLPGMKTHLEELKQELKETSSKLEEGRAKARSLRLNMEKMEEDYKRQEAEFMFESQQIQSKMKRLKDSGRTAEFKEAASRLEKEKKELEELREFRAKNSRTALEVMAKLYADFEKFTDKVAQEDLLKKALEDAPKSPPHGT